MFKRLVALPILLSLSGCIIVADLDRDWSWGGWTERDQVIAEVDKIEFDARGTLYVMQGTAHTLRMEGHEDALRAVRVHDRNGTLVIKQYGDEFRWWGVERHGKDAIYYLEIVNLTAVKHRGNGELNVGPFSVNGLTVQSSEHAETNFSSINARRLEINVSEHANVNVETLDADRVRITSRDHGDLYAHDVNVLDMDVTVTNHGEVWLAGTADSSDIIVRDHGDIDATRLESAVANVTAEDHSRVELTASETLNIREKDHAQVIWNGTAEVTEEVDVSQN